MSVSWRVLVAYLRLGLQGRNASQKGAISQAEAIWRGFLLGHEPNPGPYQQHLIVANFVDTANNVKLSPYFNRYLVRAVSMDFLSSESTAFTYAKMGRCILFGHVQTPHRGRWRESRVGLSRGEIELDERFGLPIGVLDYWNDAADAVAGMHGRMSTRQQRKVAEAVDKRAAEFASSEVFRAFMFDLEHSGDQAFLPENAPGAEPRS